MEGQESAPHHWAAPCVLQAQQGGAMHTGSGLGQQTAAQALTAQHSRPPGTYVAAPQQAPPYAAHYTAAQQYYYNYALQHQQVQRRIEQVKRAPGATAAAAPTVQGVQHLGQLAAPSQQLKRGVHALQRDASTGSQAWQHTASTRQRAKPGAPAGGLPPSLKTYAEQAFAMCSGEGARAQMQNKLHEMLSTAIASGTLHSTDWATAPLPVIEGMVSSSSSSSFSSSKKQPVGVVSGSLTASRGHSSSGTAAVSYSASARRSSAAPSKKKCGLEGADTDKPTVAEAAQRAERAKRFGLSGDTLQAKRRKACMPTLKRGDEYTAPGYVGETIRGTCEDLEKDYFRLTSVPDPDTVRPERVLREALTRLKRKWRDSEVEYDWACNQLKAIRQDLTVQALKSPFAVNVYETHARLSLENADMNEYNQCQTQLQELYEAVPAAAKNELEFLAYRILYYLMLASASTASSRSDAAAELRRILKNLPIEAWTNPAVTHALKVRAALNLGDYASFFKLYDSDGHTPDSGVPNMGQYILDAFVDNIRLDAAYKIIKAYKYTIPLDALARLLGLLPRSQSCSPMQQESHHETQQPPPGDSGSGVDLRRKKAAKDFILNLGFKLSRDDPDTVLLRDSAIDASALSSKSSLL